MVKRKASASARAEEFVDSGFHSDLLPLSGPDHPNKVLAVASSSSPVVERQSKVVTGEDDRLKTPKCGGNRHWYFISSPIVSMKGLTWCRL